MRRDLGDLSQNKIPIVSQLLLDEEEINQHKDRYNHIKFVANSKDQLEEQRKFIRMKKLEHEANSPSVNGHNPGNEVSELHMGEVKIIETHSVNEPDYGRVNVVNSKSEDPLKKGAIQQAMDQLSDLDQHDAINQFTAPVQNAVLMPMDDGFGNAWSANYKYNTFGEPVYGKTNRPNYIPKERVVHFDLKGAPPKMSTIINLIPWLSQHGATMVLLEYEEMFPFHGSLSDIRGGNHYTPTEIKKLLDTCEQNKIEVIPLVQTFGHMEFALKVEKFSHLRESPITPQALCPSRNESLSLVYEPIDQVMRIHSNSRYLHIGCDEVFTMGECDLCNKYPRENLFLKHVATVAKYVKSKYGTQVLIWDDMLRHVPDFTMREYHLGELVEPMVWVYAEDIYRFMPPSTWSKFSQVFSHVWAASAYKGAFGEQLTVPNVRRHLDNHMNWLDVMATEASKFKGGFRGLVLTGWQRYDHFAVLCELLPASIPSLAVNLISVSHGFFNSTLQSEIYSSLNCFQSSKYQSWIDLDQDPYLWDKFSWCFFPGKEAFTLMSRLDSVRREVDAYVNKITRSRAWISDYNRRHNFSSPMRIDEDLEEMTARIHTVTSLVKSAKDALGEFFDEWTVGEWIEQHLWPMLSQLQTIQRESESMKRRRTWPVRPLPLLAQLSEYGVSGPTSAGNSALNNQIQGNYGGT